MSHNDQGQRPCSLITFWLVLSVIPLFTVLISFILGGWFWGLMDDYGFMTVPGSVWDRITALLPQSVSSGRVVPVYYIHAAVFYKIFAGHPGAFFIFRWFECVLALGGWAWLAFRVTRRLFAVPLFLLAALSFYKVYDAFFFLSTNEILGVFFFGLAAHCFLNAIRARLESGGKIRRGALAAGCLFLLLAVGSKEPFLVAVGALGLGAILVSLNGRQKGILWGGIAGVVLAAGYAVFLKVVVMRGYSAAYAIADPGVIGQNIWRWVQSDLLFHLPWILFAVVVSGTQQGGAFQPWTRTRRWAFGTGVAAYTGYTLVILPWSVWGHYVLPLGVFFAFSLAVYLADRVEALGPVRSLIVGAAAFFFSLIVGAAALKFHSTYQYDTANLLKWLATNAFFEHEMESGAVVRGNAFEPCATIVNQVNGIYGKKYQPFVFSPGVRDVLADIRTRYYLWGPKWGDQDLSRLGKMWTPMFVSEHWVLFRRMN